MVVNFRKIEGTYCKHMVHERLSGHQLPDGLVIAGPPTRLAENIQRLEHFRITRPYAKYVTGFSSTKSHQ